MAGLDGVDGWGVGGFQLHNRRDGGNRDWVLAIASS